MNLIFPREGHYIFPMGVDPDGKEVAFIPISYIISIVEKAFELDRGDILGPQRPARIVRPRQVAYWLTRTIHSYTYQLIGREFGRTHDSILSGIETLENHRNRNDALDYKCRRLLSNLLSEAQT